MSILLKRVKIVDPSSPFNGEIKDVLINGDQITRIEDNIDESAKQVVQENGLCISPGWVELHSDFCDPGYEHKETIESGTKAAVFGGFTTVVLTPQTQPVLQSKDGIEYIYRKADEQSIHLLPLGATTKNLEGKELSELYDMHQSGAVGFYNGKNSIENPNVQKLALLYTRTFNAPVFTFPNQKNLSENGQMNEGETSTYLGLKGLPSLSEEITIQRDIYLCEYCESAIHFTSISSAKSVELIREAKARGLNVTCDVNLYNLVLTDEELTSYDTRYKVLPPIRTNDDRLALIEGLKDGTIDAIAVDHIPQDIELKKCEFEHAAFGMRGLETALGLYGKQLAESLGWENWVNWISHNPRNILGSSQISINNGSIAELTLFNPNADWKIDIKSLKPTSENNPFYKSDLKGKAFGIVNKGKLVRS